MIFASVDRPKSRSVLLSLLCLAPWLAPATALGASGPYLGGGLGRAKIQDESPRIPGGSFSETGHAWRVYGGYRFDSNPSVHLATEAGFRDSGRAENGSSGQDSSYRIKGWDTALLAILPAGRIDLFGKVGGLHYAMDRYQGGFSNPRNGLALLYGGGVTANLSHLSLRLEYERSRIADLHSVTTLWALLQTRP